MSLAIAQATGRCNVDGVPVGGEHHLDRSRAVEEAIDVAPKALGRRGDVGGRSGECSGVLILVEALLNGNRSRGCGRLALVGVVVGVWRGAWSDQ